MNSIFKIILSACLVTLNACGGKINTGILPSKGIHLKNVSALEARQIVSLAGRVAAKHGLVPVGTGIKDAEYVKPNHSFLGHFFVPNLIYLEIGPGPDSSMDIVVSSSGHKFRADADALFKDLNAEITKQNDQWGQSH